jgi:hypothetical protein
MQLSTVLPEGMIFPYDFGFVPSTVGQDGDPLDILILMDEPVVPGCVVRARLTDMSARVTLWLSSRTLFARPISLSHAARLKRLVGAVLAIEMDTPHVHQCEGGSSAGS